MKLTNIQQRAFEKTSTEWKTPYELKESTATLNILFQKGLLEKRGAGSLGSMYSPVTTLEYRRVVTGKNPFIILSGKASADEDLRAALVADLQKFDWNLLGYPLLEEIHGKIASLLNYTP